MSRVIMPGMFLGFVLLTAVWFRFLLTMLVSCCILTQIVKHSISGTTGRGSNFFSKNRKAVLRWRKNGTRIRQFPPAKKTPRIITGLFAVIAAYI